MDDVILTAQRANALCITINRPASLNALNAACVDALRARLADALHNPSITTVIIRGAGDRAFCAGGDVRAIHALLIAGELARATEFFTREFMLNAELAAFAETKPTVALWNGVVMGGGAGVSCYCKIRVATERTVFAMPECAIGLWPDVGAGWFLHRDVGHAFAVYLSLTGARVRGIEAKIVGLATHYIELETWERDVQGEIEVLGDACDPRDVADVIRRRESTVDATAVSYAVSDEGREAIEDVFGDDQLKSVNDILCAIDAREANAESDVERAFWNASSAAMRKGSPTSLAVSLELMRRARGQSLEWCLGTDNVLIRKFLAGEDFRRGVDAMLIKKTGVPPANGWAAASPRVVEEYFSGAPDSKL